MCVLEWEVEEETWQCESGLGLCVDVPVTLSSRLESAVSVTLVGLMRE